MEIVDQDILLIVEAARENGIHLSAELAEYIWSRHSQSKNCDWIRLDNYTNEQIWTKIKDHII